MIFLKNKTGGSPIFESIGYRFILMALLSLVLNACAMVGVENKADGADTGNKPSELTGDLLYQLLVGEFAGSTGGLDVSRQAVPRA